MQESCDIYQPPILAGESMFSYTQTSKFNTWMFYDDLAFQVSIDKSGGLLVNRMFLTDPMTTASWQKLADAGPNLPPIVKNITDVLENASKIFMARDKKVINFPSRKFTEIATNLTAAGDVWFLLADKYLYSVVMNSNGTFNPHHMKVIDTELEADKVTKIMVADSNVIIMVDKKIQIYQYQNQKFELKQFFNAFKDVEDVAITRLGGIRLYKIKGSKNKYLVLFLQLSGVRTLRASAKLLNLGI